MGRAGEIYLILGNSEDNGLARLSRFGTAYTSSISFDASTNKLLPYKRVGMVHTVSWVHPTANMIRELKAACCAFTRNMVELDRALYWH